MKLLAKLSYPLCTIVLTVLSFIFYSMCVVNGLSLSEMAQGTMMLGHHVPLLVVFLVESCLAFLLEMTFGHPFSDAMVEKFQTPTTPAIVSYAISVAATVLVMCPAMSLLAAILYSMEPLTLGTLLVNWIRLVCTNLGFVFFLQLLFLQPFLQWAFGKAASVFNREAAFQSE